MFIYDLFVIVYNLRLDHPLYNFHCKPPTAYGERFGGLKTFTN